MQVTLCDICGKQTAPSPVPHSFVFELGGVRLIATQVDEVVKTIKDICPKCFVKEGYLR